MNRKQTTEDRRRHEVLNQMLTERQAEIRNKLRSLREVLPSEVTQVRDPEEQSMEEFVLGMDFALMEMESGTLRKIDEALLRLEDGTYGVCTDCDESISEARLKALPFAGLCRDCQERAEETAAARNARPSRFFEDGPPAAPRERRGGGEKKTRPSWDAPARPAAPVAPVVAAPVMAAADATARTMRAVKPARVGRARS
ncbi:MAG TPA: TraR/DksA C4-type zinc finger protein [Vicinamibacteria bacterium]|nr:TraR/DksA C4-type zinc finger protein [Vicinamibacteria bacterium]